MTDTFDIPTLDAALAGTPFAGQIRFFPSIHSTNTLAMQEADGGAPAGRVYLADEQTAGRGRGAHEWRSAAGSGLYVSVLLRPGVAPADVLWFSLAAGLAVHAAVKEVTALEPDIRWPNDLLLSGKKFCGILTELNAEVTRVRHMVIGIGINVHQAAFPAELSSIATSLAIETEREWRRQDLLIALLGALHRETEALTGQSRQRDGNMGGSVGDELLVRLAKASSWVRGKQVTVEETDTVSGGFSGPFSGTTDGLDSRGFLRVRTADGIRTVLSGGVREANPERKR
ncbi:MAG: biotin--[acetyl-CoA-carboxylase] ligase [Acidobacteriaceae bacterium]